MASYVQEITGDAIQVGLPVRWIRFFAGAIASNAYNF